MTARAAVIAVSIALVTPAWSASVPFGAAAIDYDPSLWEISVIRPPGAWLETLAADAPVSLWLFCTAPDCRGRKERSFVWASATPVTGVETDRCAEPTLGDWPIRHGKTARIDGPLRFIVTTTFSGCRAYTPAHRRACAIDGPFRYELGTGAHFGCGGVEGVPEALFLDLLKAIRPTGAGAAPR